MCLKYVASDLYNHCTIWWQSVYHIIFFINLSPVESTCFSYSPGDGPDVRGPICDAPANALQINAREDSNNGSVSEKYNKENYM